MSIAIRVDSSYQIGIGHLMRCLTLAEELRKNRVETSFICRNHAGNLNSLIISKGFSLFELDEPCNDSNRDYFSYSSWLGVSYRSDAEQVVALLKDINPTEVIVDHYALDHRWESMIGEHVKKIIVIDDLANRNHNCDILIDQTLNRSRLDYQALVRNDCNLLLGTKYALLRDEFSQWRKESLKRKKFSTRKVLLSLGGIDKDNMTSLLMRVLNENNLELDSLTVVMGQNAPCLNEVLSLKQEMHIPTEVLTGVSNMAELMANCDLAIGAAGSTSWERCCLGLPSYMLVLADNQKEIAEQLMECGAAKLVQDPIESNLVKMLKEVDKKTLNQMSLSSRNLVDGLGVARVVEKVLHDED